MDKHESDWVTFGQILSDLLDSVKTPFALKWRDYEWTSTIDSLGAPWDHGDL